MLHVWQKHCRISHDSRAPVQRLKPPVMSTAELWSTNGHASLVFTVSGDCLITLKLLAHYLWKQVSLPSGWMFRPSPLITPVINDVDTLFNLKRILHLTSKTRWWGSYTQKLYVPIVQSIFVGGGDQVKLGLKHKTGLKTNWTLKWHNLTHTKNDKWILPKFPLPLSQ